MRFKYPVLLATLLALALVSSLFTFGMVSSIEAVFLMGLFQAALICLDRGRPALFTVGCSQSQFDEMEKMLRGMKSYEGLFKELPDRLKRLEKENDGMRAELRTLRKGSFAGPSGVRWLNGTPFVTEDCATALTSVLVLSAAEVPGALESLVHDGDARDRVKAHASSFLGIATRAAQSLTGSDIPLPTVYVPQIIELVFAYGQARKFATVYPLGAGTVKLPRLKAGEDTFAYLGAGTAGMSQTVSKKEVTAELITFTANKFGGLISIPTEIEVDTFVPLGQFLARYIARQFAKGEDSALFLADGSSNYANMTGIGPYCDAGGANTYTWQLAATKTHPSDAALADFRNMRSLVSPAVLAGSFDAAYYLSPTFEPFLRSFNQYPNFIVFENENGKATFDGWPVRWIGVSQTYAESVAANAYIAFFGALSYWYLGERGAPRVEVSRDVFFTTDEIAMRALERIDVECMGIDAMATLKTAGA